MAALHDIGKVNVGFQTQTWRDDDLPFGQRRPEHAGHYNEMTPLIDGADHRTALDSSAHWAGDGMRLRSGMTEPVKPSALFSWGRYHITGSPRSWRGTCQTTLDSGCPWATLTLCKGYSASASWSANGSRPPLRLARLHCHLRLTSSTCSWGYVLWLTGLAPIRNGSPSATSPIANIWTGPGPYLNTPSARSDWTYRGSGQQLPARGRTFFNLFQFGPNAIQQAAVTGWSMATRSRATSWPTG